MVLTAIAVIGILALAAFAYLLLLVRMLTNLED